MFDGSQHTPAIRKLAICLFISIYFFSLFSILCKFLVSECLQQAQLPPVLLRTPHPPTHILPPHTFSNLLDNLWNRVPCEQRFLFCMVFSVYKVIRVACLSRSWFVLVNKLTTRNTSRVNYFVNAKSHAREKPLLEEQGYGHTIIIKLLYRESRDNKRNIAVSK